MLSRFKVGSYRVCALEFRQQHVSIQWEPANYHSKSTTPPHSLSLLFTIIIISNLFRITSCNSDQLNFSPPLMRVLRDLNLDLESTPAHGGGSGPGADSGQDFGLH